MAPEFEQEGCVLMDSDTAHAKAKQLGIPTVYASHTTGAARAPGTTTG